MYSRYSPEIVEKASPLDFDREWDCTVEKLELPSQLVPAMANIAGESASSIDMMKKVKAWQAANESAYRSLVARLDSANKRTIAAMRKIRDNQPDFDEFREAFGESRAATRELGELSGAPIAFCAKLPGAGGGDAIAALCKSEADRTRLHSFWRSYGAVKLEPLDITGGAGGVRSENDARL